LTECKFCGKSFLPSKVRYRYCSQFCAKKIKTLQCKHPKEYYKTRIQYNRQHDLNSNGHHKVTKRPFSVNCEVCNKPLKIPYSYHHWDTIEPKEKITKGIWVCKKCHDIISCHEIPEYKERFNKYLLIKKEIDNQYMTK
jgi:hypothetical protein